MTKENNKQTKLLSDIDIIEDLSISDDEISKNIHLGDDNNDNDNIDITDLIERFENDDWDDDYDNYIPISSSDKSLKSIDKSNKKRNKPKKIKVPMTKRKKHIVFLTVTPLMILICVLITFASMFLMVNGFGQKVDSTSLAVDLHNQYFVGTEGKINLQKIFPDGTDFTLSDQDDATTLASNTLTIGLKNFKITYKDTKTNQKVTMQTTVIKNGINVDTYEKLYKNAHTTEEEIKNEEFKKPVLIQNKEISMKLRYKNNDSKRQATINLTNDLYGNGATINANSVVYGFGTEWKNRGWPAFSISQHSAIKNKPILIRDLHLIGKEPESTDTLKTFTNYGSLLDIAGAHEGAKSSDDKAKATIENSIFERSHKVIHLSNAKIDMKGTIVRTAADTTISIATSANSATTLNIENCIIADSLTAGILMYCIDKNIGISNDNIDTWNQINIKGFLDIYNWKKSSEIALLPDTEGGPQVASLANGIVRSEVDNPKKNQAYKVTKDNEQYVHFGIIQICTVSNAIGLNKSVVTNYTNQGFRQEEFPIPDAAKAIIKDVKVCGYMNNANGAIGPTTTIKDNIANIYNDLYFGRKA